MPHSQYTKWDADWDAWYGESIPLVFKLTIEEALQEGDLHSEMIADVLFWLRKANAHEPLISAFERIQNNFDENLSLEAEDNRP